jgi:hypothetical protein
LYELTVTLRASKIISYLSSHTFNATGDFSLTPGNDSRDKVCLKGAQYIILSAEPWEISCYSRIHSYQWWTRHIAQNRLQKLSLFAINMRTYKHTLSLSYLEPPARSFLAKLKALAWRICGTKFLSNILYFT